MANPVLVNGVTGVSNTAIPVRSGASQSLRIVSVSAFNPSAAVAWVQLYDSAIAPTVGTTVPTWSLGLNTLTARDINLTGDGLNFQNGCWVAATTTVNGSSAPATNLNVNLSLST